MSSSVEVFGNDNCGKTSFVLSQLEKDDIVLYIDADNHLNYNILKEWHNLQYMNISVAEQIYDVISQIVEYLDVVVIDSIAALKTEKEDMSNINLDKELFMVIKKIITLCRKHEVTIICINQLRVGQREYNTFGLKFLGHYFTQRIEVVNSSTINIIKKIK